MSLMRNRINIVALELTICCRVVEDNGEVFFLATVYRKSRCLEERAVEQVSIV